LRPDNELDWTVIDQMVRLRLMPPKDHAPLADADALAISKYASDVWLWRRSQAQQAQVEQPQPPVNPNPNTGTPPPAPQPPGAGTDPY
jgi:hypothetical protein